MDKIEFELIPSSAVTLRTRIKALKGIPTASHARPF